MVMNYPRYDMAYGNHEFNYYLRLDRSRANRLRWGESIVSPMQNDRPEAATPATTLEKTVDGKLFKSACSACPHCKSLGQAHLDGKVTTYDAKDAATKAAAELVSPRISSPSITVAIPSLHPRAEMWATRWRSRGIDAMIMGHSHSFFPDGKNYADIPKADNKTGKVNGVPAVMPGFWGNHLGVITLELEQKDGKWSVASSKSEIRPIALKDTAGTTTGYVAPDTQEMLVQAEHDTVTYVSTPIGTRAIDASFFSQSGDTPR